MLPDKELNLLVVGGGGREHAICWKLAQSPRVDSIHCAPGNGGTATEAKTTNVDIKVTEFDKLVEFTKTNKIDLVIIGPDNPLADGIVDHLKAHGIRVFGPTKDGAKLEWSKAFAKDFMQKHDIPTARFKTVSSKSEGIAFVEKNEWARVVKVDGLALGKGVFVCDSLADAQDALTEIFDKGSFGDAASTVLLEERLSGEEMSLLFFCDGKRLVPMPASQDHKRRFDGDAGPNTGGMGVYAPVELFDRCKNQIQELLVKPFEKALQNGFQYQGIVYAGMMVTAKNEPYVLEFNARFGDPETQALLPLLKTDLLEILWACTDSSLDSIDIRWQDASSCCVVAAAKAYPASSSKDAAITIGELMPGSIVFHAGTRRDNANLVTAGGRVLAITAVAATMDEARNKAYESIKSVSFADMDYRTDIARSAVKQCLSN